MRILSCTPFGYYGNPSTVSYEYVSFVEIPRLMGHRVHHFDHVRAAAGGREAMNEFFVSIVERGGYDLVWVMMSRDEFLPEALDAARRHTVVAAWNCDDDWRWEDYSSRWAPHFTYMVTTYRHVYEAHRAAHPNLLLSQWGCTGLHEGTGVGKDIPISFVGKIHGSRREQIERLRAEFGLEAYGSNIPAPLPALTRWKQRIAWHVLGLRWEGPDRSLPDEAAVKAVWNRSRIAFTPLEAGVGRTLQIKARVFDMGLSGTVMLCNRHGALEEFYEPGREYADFDSMDECVDKARWLLAHDSEREAIARRYAERTRREHLWSHRFDRLYRAMGLLQPEGRR